MSAPVAPSAAAAWAAAWIAASPGQRPQAPAGDPPPWTELCWAVKEECERAWTTSPARARRCAEVLAEIAAIGASRLAPALSEWAAGVASLTLGRPKDAEQGFERAQRGFEALGLPLRAAEMQVPRIAALAMLGRDDEALDCGGQALAVFVAAGETRGAAKVEVNLGSILLRRERYADAALNYRRAALHFARIGDHPHSIMADIGLATVLAAQHDFEAALQMAERARRRAESRALEPLLSVVHSTLGRLELLRGRWAQALRWLEQALRSAERSGRQGQALAEVQRNLADAYLRVNLLPEAEALYERAIAHAEDAPLERAWSLVQRASAHARMGRGRDAIDGLAEADALFRRLGNGVGLGVVALHRAALELQGSDAGAAGVQAALAVSLFGEAGIGGWQLEAQLLQAAALESLGLEGQAEALFRQTIAEAGDLPHLVALGALGLGRMAQRRGLALEAAAQFERAVQEFELQHEALAGDELRTAFGDGQEQAFDALVQVALQTAAQPLQLLAAMDRGRSRALRRERRQAGGSRAEVDPQTLQLRGRLQWLHREWQQAIAAGRREVAERWQRERQEVERALLDRHRRQRLARAESASNPGGTSGPAPGAGAHPAPAFEALADSLASDQALVVFHLLGDEIIAAVVTRQGARSVRSPAVGVNASIEQMRFQLDALRFRQQALAAHAKTLFERARAHMRMLHHQIWAPIVPLLAGRPRVVVVPHRQLHYVPFAALHDGHAWLVESTELSQTPGVASWLANRTWAPRGPIRVVAAGVAGETLPHVTAELQAVAAAFPGRTTLLADAQATVAEVRAAAGGADILHLACHGEFRADSPSFSFLQLADGPLTLEDAAGWSLDGALVTLSACDTGVSLVSPGDEMIGLMRGFLLAGAASVMSTLWTVDDETTAQLMATLYGRIAGGAPPAAALRAAQIALLRDAPHPYHWAPFTLHRGG